jgi:hypothetical protein
VVEICVLYLLFNCVESVFVSKCYIVNVVVSYSILSEMLSYDLKFFGVVSKVLLLFEGSICCQMYR